MACLVILVGGYYPGAMAAISGLVRFLPCRCFWMVGTPDTLPASSVVGGAPSELLRLSLPVLLW